jgi:hypothetical protein
MWVWASLHLGCGWLQPTRAVTSVSRQAVALNSRGVQAAKRSCAFKAGSGDPLYYPGYKQITWEDAPACNGQPPAGASVDSQVRWRSRAATLCRRTQQQLHRSTWLMRQHLRSHKQGHAQKTPAARALQGRMWGYQSGKSAAAATTTSRGRACTGCGSHSRCLRHDRADSPATFPRGMFRNVLEAPVSLVATRRRHAHSHNTLHSAVASITAAAQRITACRNVLAPANPRPRGTNGVPTHN